MPECRVKLLTSSIHIDLEMELAPFERATEAIDAPAIVWSGHVVGVVDAASGELCAILIRRLVDSRLWTTSFGVLRSTK